MNNNDAIIDRIRGVPANAPDWRGKFDPQNPNAPQDNDNEPPDPRRDCPWKCRADDQACACQKSKSEVQP